MVAGYLAGSSGTIVGYPLESLKVWMQTNTIGKNRHLDSQPKGSGSRRKLPKDAASSSKLNTRGKSPSRSNSTTCSKTNGNNDIARSSKSSGAKRCNSTTTATLQQQMKMQRGAAAARFAKNPLSTAFGTVRALYSGVTGPLITVGMVQSVNFATINATRQILYRRQHPDCTNPREYLTEDSLLNVAVSGSMGGMTTALVTAPLLMLKINQQITGNTFRKGFGDIFVAEIDGVRQIRPFRPYGAAFVPHAMSETIGRAIYVTAYEGLKRALLESKRRSASGSSDGARVRLNLRERMLAAAGSGIVCWGTFFPLDALRNRMFHAQTRRKSGAPKPHPLVEIAQTVKVMHSERAFYRGFSISILRAGPVAASVLPVYDLTLEWLSSSSSSSTTAS
jgi:ribosomal protein L34E